MPDPAIRPVTPADAPRVADLVAAAFGRSDEARLVEWLTTDGDAAIALVAERREEIAGHILLSPMSAPFRALGLAPVSVAPDLQGQGIGGALIRAAIERASAADWRAIFVLGEPDYYGRFGFSVAAAQRFDSPYAGPYFQLLALDDRPLAPGEVAYAPAFARL